MDHDQVLFRDIQLLLWLLLCLLARLASPNAAAIKAVDVTHVLLLGYAQVVAVVCARPAQRKVCCVLPAADDVTARHARVVAILPSLLATDDLVCGRIDELLDAFL